MVCINTINPRLNEKITVYVYMRTYRFQNKYNSTLLMRWAQTQDVEVIVAWLNKYKRDKASNQ